MKSFLKSVREYSNMRCSFIILVCALMVMEGEMSSTCLFCKRSDSRAMIGQSFSYCESSDTCLEDQWMYYNYGCTSGWRVARGFPLGSCRANNATCNGGTFTSTKQYIGLYTNSSATLQPNTYCTVKLDASSFVGRVVFDN